MAFKSNNLCEEEKSWGREVRSEEHNPFLYCISDDFSGLIRERAKKKKNTHQLPQPVMYVSVSADGSHLGD